MNTIEEIDVFKELAVSRLDALTAAIRASINGDNDEEQDMLLFLSGVTEEYPLRGRGLSLIRRHERFLVTGQPAVLLRYEEEGI